VLNPEITTNGRKEHGRRNTRKETNAPAKEVRLELGSRQNGKGGQHVRQSTGGGKGREVSGIRKIG